jgi:plasmid maintenance system antidote protein VapI
MSDYRGLIEEMERDRREARGRASLPPGQTLRDALREHGLTVDELSSRIDLPGMLFNGELPINEPLARRLATYFGTSKAFWMDS